MIPLICTTEVKRLLCIGAHPDDIEIGAGGTILRLVAENPEIEVCWVVLCGEDPKRAEEARKSAAAFTAGAKNLRLDIHRFKDSFLPSQRDDVKRAFESLKQEFTPDLVITHWEGDRHQDHRIASELTWNTWRNHAILEYEILKWDGDLGRPSIFFGLSQEASQHKVNMIVEYFVSQHEQHWFSRETLIALMRIRGVECKAEFAEAFYARKLLA